MDDVGPVLDDGRGEAAAGQSDTDLGVARERQGGDSDDGARRLSIGPGTGPPDEGGAGRGDNERRVTAIYEVPGGLERAVGHAVHVGGKDSVTMTTRIPVFSPCWTWSRQRGSLRTMNVP